MAETETKQAALPEPPAETDDPFGADDSAPAPLAVREAAELDDEGAALDAKMIEDLKVPRTFFNEREGRQYILYGGLVWLLHEQSKDSNGRPRFRITTSLTQEPTEANGHTAVASAEVAILDEKGVVVRSTSGIGDASPTNTNRMVALHTRRMAETRAKARAMRDLCNVGVAAFEELGGDPDEHERMTHTQAQQSRGGAPAQQQVQRNKPQPPPNAKSYLHPNNNGAAPRPQSAPQQSSKPAIRRAGPAEETITVNKKPYTRSQVVAKYEEIIGKLKDVGLELEQRLPETAPLQELVDHTTELHGAYRDAKREAAGDEEAQG